MSNMVGGRQAQLLLSRNVLGLGCEQPMRDGGQTLTPEFASGPDDQVHITTQPQGNLW